MLALYFLSDVNHHTQVNDNEGDDAFITRSLLGNYSSVNHFKSVSEDNVQIEEEKDTPSN